MSCGPSGLQRMSASLQACAGCSAGLQACFARKRRGNCMCRLKWLAVVVALGLTPGVARAQTGGHPLPPPWQQTDVGDVGLAGNATEGPDGDLFISGAGSDIWGTADSFHFMYQTIYDGEISMRAGFTDTPGTLNPHAKIGLMIRSTVAPD